jgi:hypothetical protein
MELIISPTGKAKCIYSEALPLSQLGKLSITRASRVEPDSVGNWTADLSPVGGPQLGPFDRRTDALAAEVNWLRKNWLLSQD